jgi:L-iditol 2-dehydrogenase
VCQYCQAGFYNLCLQRRILGFWTNGAFAEYIRVPAKRLHRLPETVSFQEGAMTEPLACCVHALLELTTIEPGELVVVTGPGTIGLLALQMARICGAEVVMLGTNADEERFRIAEKLGAAKIINVEKEDAVQIVLDMTGGFGSDVVVECSGAAAAAGAAIQLVRKRGRYTQMGLYGKPIPFDLEKVALKEIRLTGSFAQKWSAWKRALSLMGKNMVDLKSLISGTFPLARWEQAFDKLNGKQGIKIILDPQDRSS